MSENPTDEELKAAAELAEALESREPKAGSADDALAAAQLLRYARSGGALDPSRLTRGRAELEAELQRRSKRVRWGGFMATAAAVLIAGFAVLTMRQPKSAPPPIDPQRAVLMAQARAVAEHDPAVLASAMSHYRDGWLDGLERHYGGAP